MRKSNNVTYKMEKDTQTRLIIRRCLDHMSSQDRVDIFFEVMLQLLADGITYLSNLI